MWLIHLIMLLSYVPLPVRTQDQGVQHFSDAKAGRVSWVVDGGVLPWTGTYNFIPSKSSQSTVLLTVVDSSNGNHLGECTSSKGSNDWSKFSWRLSEDSLLCNVSGSVVSKVRFPPTKDPRTFSVRILAGRGPRCFRNLTIENEQILGCPPSLNTNLFQSTSFECGCDARTLSGAEQLIHHKGSGTSSSSSVSDITTIVPSNADASNSRSFMHRLVANSTDEQTRLSINNQSANQTAFTTPSVFEMTPRTLNTQPCAQVECLNNGTCVLAPDGQASCLCLEGFNGERCEFSACATMPCMNGGVCRISGAEPICECPFGVTGILCEQAICDPLCENGGSCELVNGTALCQCLPGTTGINCNLMDVCAEASTCAVFGERARCRLDPNSLMLISPVPVNASYLCECANDHNEWVNCLELAMQAGPFTSLPPLIAVKPSTLNISQPTGVNATKIGSSISVLSGLFNRSSVMNKTNEESPFNVSGELPFPHLNTDSPTLLHSITTTEPSGTANELTTTQQQDLTSTDELNRQLLSGFIFPGLTNATGSSKHSSSNDSSEVLSSSESVTDADLSSAPNRTSLLFPPFSSFTIPNFTNLSSEQLLTTTMQPFSPAVNATKLTDMQQNQSELPWSPFEERLLTNTPPTTDLPTEPDYDLPTDETSPSTTEKTDVPLSTEGFGSETTSNEETATTEASIPSSQLTTMRSIVVSTTNFEQSRISTTTEAEQSSEPPTTSPEDEDEMGNEVVTSEVDHYPYASSSSSTPTPYQPDSNQSHKASAADDSSSTSWIIALVIAIVFLLLLAVIALFVVRYIQRSRKLHGKYNPAREENVLANSFSMPMTTVTKEERLI